MQELVLRQTFLIAKGYFDPKEYFQAIKIDNLDDQTFDNKIKAMFNWSLQLFNHFQRWCWYSVGTINGCLWNVLIVISQIERIVFTLKRELVLIIIYQHMDNSEMYSVKAQQYEK